MRFLISRDSGAPGLRCSLGKRSEGPAEGTQQGWAQGALGHELPHGLVPRGGEGVGLCVLMSSSVTGSAPPSPLPGSTLTPGHSGRVQFSGEGNSCELLASSATAAGGWGDLSRAPAMSLRVPDPG